MEPIIQRIKLFLKDMFNGHSLSAKNSAVLSAYKTYEE